VMEMAHTQAKRVKRNEKREKTERGN
jgi:hypothetical protein